MIVLSVMQAIQKMVTIILQIILNHFFIFIFLYNFFFFQYLKISNDSLAKYYQKNIERLLKKLAEGIKKQKTTICSQKVKNKYEKLFLLVENCLFPLRLCLGNSLGRLNQHPS